MQDLVLATDAKMYSPVLWRLGSIIDRAAGTSHVPLHELMARWCEEEQFAQQLQRQQSKLLLPTRSLSDEQHSNQRPIPTPPSKQHSTLQQRMSLSGMQLKGLVTDVQTVSQGKQVPQQTGVGVQFDHAASPRKQKQQQQMMCAQHQGSPKVLKQTALQRQHSCTIDLRVKGSQKHLAAKHEQHDQYPRRQLSIDSLQQQLQHGQMKLSAMGDTTRMQSGDMSDTTRMHSGALSETISAAMADDTMSHRDVAALDGVAMQQQQHRPMHASDNCRTHAQPPADDADNDEHGANWHASDVEYPRRHQPKPLVTDDDSLPISRRCSTDSCNTAPITAILLAQCLAPMPKRLSGIEEGDAAFRSISNADKGPPLHEEERKIVLQVCSMLTDC